MKLFKLLVLVAAFGALYAAEEPAYVIQMGPNTLYTIDPGAQFLYNLSNSAKSDAEFVDLVLNNEEGRSLGECIAILKKNQQHAQNTLKFVDDIYYSSRNLSKGLMLGALTLGGLVAVAKGAQWIRDLNDMYIQEQIASGYIHAGLLEKIKSLRPAGSWFRKGFVTKEEEKEIAAQYKEAGINPPVHATYKSLLLDTFAKYGLVDTWAPEQTEKALQGAGFDTSGVVAREKAKNLPYVAAFGLTGGAALYGKASSDLITYVDNFYKAYQKNKADRNEVLQAMEQGDKMLQVLQAVELE